MKAFVIMPFGNQIANDTYRLSTKPVCEEFKLEVERADEIFTTNPILDDVITAIKDASIIIADISGKNPNVFYELGLSHILKQSQTIMITQDEFGKIPFDISHFRILRYENTITGKSSYEDQLRKTLQNILLDYRAIYKNEFDLIINALRETGKDHELFVMLALAQTPKPLVAEAEFDVTGYNKKFEMPCVGSNYPTVKHAVALFLMFDLVRIANNFVIITEKGNAFVEIVKEKGYVLNKANLE